MVAVASPPSPPMRPAATWTTLAASVDMYGSSVASLVDMNSVSVPSACKALFRLRALSKNASSTGYFMPVNSLNVQRVT